MPTTILALQHFKTFSARLKEFPCTVDYINRFKTSKQIKETLERVAQGKVDIIIGTQIVAKGHNFPLLTLVGVIDAGMFHELTAKGAFPQAWIDETQKMLALKRWGQPEEIGYAVSYLASSRAAYVTGQQISVSGGFGL